VTIAVPSQQQATAPVTAASPVRGLLAAYQGVLDVMHDLPAAPQVLWTHADRGPRAWVRYLPRPKWLLRLFVVRHIDATLGLLERRYCAHAALGSLTESGDGDRAAVKEFRQSLPPVRRGLHLLLLAAAVLTVARPLLGPIVVMTQTVDAGLPAGTERSGKLEAVRATLKTLTEGFSTDVSAINKTIGTLVNGGAQQAGVLALALALAVYLVLRPFVPAFRLKRMLFNLAPDRRRPPPSATSRWSLSQSAGVYERERLVLAELGVRAPREFPFDLVVPALAMLAPLIAAGRGIAGALTLTAPEDRWLFAVMGTLFLTIATARLAWLFLVWRRRLRASGPWMPFDAGVGDGPTVVKVERPFGVRMLVFALILINALAVYEPAQTVATYLADNFAFALVLTAPLSLAWMVRVNRELRAIDPRPRSRTRRMVGRAVVAGAVIIVPAILMALVVTGLRIRRAQARAGLPQTLRLVWLLPGVLVHPLLVAYLQRELNKIWTATARPLDPWPGVPPVPATGHPARPPWLRRAAPAPGLG
jgi:hypothetical protein